ncbi:hypothetical protein [Methylobacterium sp. J-070]|uniref:hypothetical protein n=1 Tax=Methylobacterium sp. J-070 TaxID=2836650 RepID=UPI00391D03BD
MPPGSARAAEEGRPADHLATRSFGSRILHALTSGCRWRDCLAAYGPRTTVGNPVSRRGVWEGRPLGLDLDGQSRRPPSTAEPAGPPPAATFGPSHPASGSGSAGLSSLHAQWRP